MVRDRKMIGSVEANTIKKTFFGLAAEDDCGDVTASSFGVFIVRVSWVARKGWP